MYCPKCGNQISDDSRFCPYCGEKVNTSSSNDSYVSDDLNKTIHPENTYNASPKSRAIAAVLAWFFGAFGVHLFYVGRTTGGILSVIFFWTGIPAIISFIHFIIILCGGFNDGDGLPIVKW